MCSIWNTIIMCKSATACIYMLWLYGRNHVYVGVYSFAHRVCELEMNVLKQLNRAGAAA